MPIERFNCWLASVACKRCACGMSGAICPLTILDWLWSARTTMRIARRLVAMSNKEANTKRRFLTRLRCILSHSVRVTFGSPDDPQGSQIQHLYQAEA